MTKEELIKAVTKHFIKYTALKEYIKRHRIYIDEDELEEIEKQLSIDLGLNTNEEGECEA